MRKTTTKTADKTLVTPKKREKKPTPIDTLLADRVLYTTQQAAQLLNIGPRKLTALLVGDRPMIASLLNGNKRLIPRKAIEQFIDDIVTQKVREI